MFATKIQDVASKVIGIYQKTSKGRYANDYVILQDSGDLIKILGITDLHNFFRDLRFGTKVSLKYVGTEEYLAPGGDVRSKIKVETKVL